MPIPKWLENMVRRKSLKALASVEKTLELLGENEKEARELLLEAKRELTELEQDIPK